MSFGTEFGKALYPKVMATWVVHEEDFWNIGWVSQLRLRGAWGASGQQPDLFAASRLSMAGTGTNQTPTLSPSAFANPDLGPERGEEFELGFDGEVLGWESVRELHVVPPLDERRDPRENQRTVARDGRNRAGEHRRGEGLGHRDQPEREGSGQRARAVGHGHRLHDAR